MTQEAMCLKNLNFEFKEGNSYAIVGKTEVEKQPWQNYLWGYTIIMRAISMSMESN